MLGWTIGVPAGVGQAEQPVDPHAGGVDHVPGPDLVALVGEPVEHRRPGDVPGVVEDQALRLGVGQHRRAEAPGRPHHGQHQPGVVGPGVAVDVGVGAAGPVERGRQRDGLLRADPVVPADVAHPREDVVGRHAQAEQPALGGVGPHRVDEVHRPNQVRREAHQQLALADAFEHEAELVVLQVAQPAVDQLARLAAGAAGEVAHVDRDDAKPPACRVERDAGAGRAEADDEDVDLAVGGVGDRGGAVVQGERTVSHRVHVPMRRPSRGQPPTG